MPIYEYRCRTCGESFEKLVRMSTAIESIECPSCGERQAERLLSTFASSSGDSAGSFASTCSVPSSSSGFS